MGWGGSEQLEISHTPCLWTAWGFSRWWWRRLGDWRLGQLGRGQSWLRGAWGGRPVTPSSLPR